MSEIGYDSFTDYILKKEKQKKKFVQSIKTRGAYSPERDYYLPFRRSVKRVCKKNDDLSKLDEMHSKLSDPRKKSGYTILIKNIKEFLQSKDYSWIDLDKATLFYGKLAISVNPELGLEIGNTKYFIKLYLKKPKITIEKINLLKKIMQDAYTNVDENIHVAIFDVRRGNFYSVPSQQSVGLTYDLDKEASNWCETWEELDI